jgi:hypothetical protein
VRVLFDDAKYSVLIKSSLNTAISMNNTHSVNHRAPKSVNTVIRVFALFYALDLWG